MRGAGDIEASDSMLKNGRALAVKAGDNNLVGMFDKTVAGFEAPPPTAASTQAAAVAQAPVSQATPMARPQAPAPAVARTEVRMSTPAGGEAASGQLQGEDLAREVSDLIDMGSDFLELGHYARARQRLERALSLDGQNSKVMALLGDCCMAEEDPESAVQWWEKAN